MKRNFFFCGSICLPLFLIFAGQIGAQTRPAKKSWDGWVVSLAGDTIFGQVRHKSGDEIKERINVKVNDTLRYNLKVEELKAFMSGDEYYLTGFLEKDGPRVALRVLSEGKLYLFEYQTLLMQGSNNAIRYEIYAFNPADSVYTLLKPINWRKQLEGMMADIPEMGEVWSKKYKFDEVKLIFDQYNTFARMREEDEAQDE